MNNSTLTRFATGLALSAVVGATLTQMTACKKKAPPPPPPRRAPPPPPPPPEPVDLVRLMDSLDGIDARVQFPQDQAPTDEGLAENVLLFTSALVSKDAEALRPMMSSAGRDVLSQVEQIWWSTDIDAVRVVMLTAGGGGQPRGGASSGLSPTIATMLAQFGDVILEALPSHARAELTDDDVHALTAGFSAPISSMDNQTARIGLELMRESTDAMAQRDLSEVRDDLGLPDGVEIPQEVQDEIAKLAPVLEAVSDYAGTVIDAIDAEADNIEASDSSATLVTALHDANGSYVLMWDAQRFDDGWFFTPQAATAELRQSVRDWDNGGLNDYRVELVAAPIIPDIPDDDDDSSNPNNDGGGGGSSSTGG